MSDTEIILAGSHASREVVDGEVVWRINLTCHPDCEPDKGVHVLTDEGTTGESSVNLTWPTPLT